MARPCDTPPVINRRLRLDDKGASLQFKALHVDAALTVRARGSAARRP